MASVPLPIMHLPDAESALALFAPLADQPTETAAFAFLDPDWRILGMRHTPSPYRDRIDVPVRTIAADAIAFDAAAIVMAHNHPSGDPSPSEADLALTRSLARLLEAIGVRLIDHFVIGAGETTSLRGLGLL